MLQSTIQIVSDKMECPFCQVLVKNIKLHFSRAAKCGSQIDLNSFIETFDTYQKYLSYFKYFPNSAAGPYILCLISELAALLCPPPAIHCTVHVNSALVCAPLFCALLL